MIFLHSDKGDMIDLLLPGKSMNESAMNPFFPGFKWMSGYCWQLRITSPQRQAKKSLRAPKVFEHSFQ